jgi:hypothetical protein
MMRTLLIPVFFSIVRIPLRSQIADKNSVEIEKDAQPVEYNRMISVFEVASGKYEFAAEYDN